MINDIRFGTRMMFKYRLHTAIALLGLSSAITSTWFIADYIGKSYSYDTFHTRHDRIYRLSMDVTAGGATEHYATTGSPLGPLLTEGYPGISAYARLNFFNPVVRSEGEVFQESGFYAANAQTVDVFSFDFLNGGGEACLTEPNSLILSQTVAKKYFGTTDITGKSLQINDDRYQITGVYRDWPKNSHIEMNGLVSSGKSDTYEPQSWFNLENYTYVLTEGGTEHSALNEQLQALTHEQLVPILQGSGLSVQLHSEPLQAVYFSAGLVEDVAKGNMTYIHALAVAGLLICLIAGLNFINLNLTSSTQRSKEFFVKQVLGISHKRLLGQCVTESLVTTGMAMTLSALLIVYFDKSYQVQTGFTSLPPWRHLPLIGVMGFLVFGFGLIGSGYARGQRILTTNGTIQSAKGNQLKKMLLGFQYGVAAIILVVTMAMNRQVTFLKNKDLGFNKEEIVIVSLPDNQASESTSSQFRHMVEGLATVAKASLLGGGALPGEENGKDLFEVTIKGKKTEKIYNIYYVDDHYFDLLEIEFASGRNFDPSQSMDRTESVIINEALARSLNWQEPMSKKIWYYGETRRVVGVVKNFHNKSLHNIIEPIVFLYEDRNASNLLVKTSSSELPELQKTWDSIFPDTPFAVRYFDDFIRAMYEKEDQLTTLFRLFAVLCVVLCTMGLFALFSLHALQKMKEMSIRKVLGADPLHLLRSLTKHYGSTLLLALLIAAPVAHQLIGYWMSGFNYTIPIGGTIYLLAGLTLGIIGALAIAYHIRKVLRVNPADALRSE